MDDKTKVIILASAVTVGYLSIKLHRSNKRYRELAKTTKKLVEWTELSQRVMEETWTKYPESASDYSKSLLTDLSFFTIIVKEDLD